MQGNYTEKGRRMTKIIMKLQDWWFWHRHNAIKSRNAEHKFNKRSAAAKLSWQKRKKQCQDQ